MKLFQNNNEEVTFCSSLGAFGIGETSMESSLDDLGMHEIFKLVLLL